MKCVKTKGIALLTGLVVSFLYGSTLEQIQREVIVQTKPGVIIMPALKNEGTLSEITVNSPELLSLLENYRVELIIKAFPDFNPADTLGIARTGEIVKLPDLSNIYKFRFPQGTDINTVIQEFGGLKDIIFADPNLIPEPEEVYPNDPYFPLQWNLDQSQDHDIDAPEAWEITRGSSDIKIGIIDGGVTNAHPDLSGKVTEDNNYPGWGWNGHGFHVAGIAAAKTNNNIGVSGVDWYAKIVSQRIDGLDVPGVYQAIMDAVNAGVHILNNSWSWSDWTTLGRIAFANAYKLNVVSVAAMGNDYGEVTVYPAGFGQGIIAVGATDQSDQRASFSNYGSHIDVSAPGVGIWSIIPSGYDDWAGTSMATPHVSGIASLLLAYNPNLYNDDIERIIRISADDVNSNQYPGWDEYLGTGRVNAHKALNLLRLPWELYHLTVSGGSVHSSTDWYTMAFFSTPGLADGVYIVKRYDIRKTVSLPANFEVTPYAWGRGVATIGFSGASPNFGMGWCNASVTGNQITLRTFVYDVYTVDGNHVGWIPSAHGNVVFAYTVLGRRLIYAPSNLHVVFVKESSVKLAWNDNSDNEMGFKIEIKGGQWTDWTEIKTVGQNVTSTTIEGLEFNTTYQFRVRAYAQEFYSNYSNTVSTTTNVLNPPTNLSATCSYPYNSVTLNWDDNSNYETGYEIYRRGIDENYQKIAELPANTTSYTDYSVSQFQDYFYKVRAKSGNIYSNA